MSISGRGGSKAEAGDTSVAWVRVPRRLTRRGSAAVLVSALVMATLFAVGASPAAAVVPTTEITSAGPLTRVILSNELNCQVAHTADLDFEFYSPSYEIGACGTLLATGGTLYGPSDVPAGDDASPRTTLTPVSQSAVTGSGTALDPYRVVTVADAGTSGLRIVETDSYVVGEEAYRTDVRVENAATSPRTAVLYRAGDCYLGGSDLGYGYVDGSRVACSKNANNSPANRIEQWIPITAGSSYYEANFSEVWSWIGTQQPFPNTCECAQFQDNGAGLSWNLSIPAGGSVTQSHLTSFSPVGNVPLTTSKAADSATSAPGGANGYTITVTNPNVGAVSLNSILDTLPAGFSYTTGSTTGATTADPAVSGQALTWSGPFNVPGGGNVSLHFGVTVSSTPGQYFNDATASAATGYSVTPTGPTAPVTVQATTRATSTTYTGASSVQYSDAATLSGTLLDTTAAPPTGVAGKTLGFTLGSQSTSAGPTDASGNASTPLTVTQAPGSLSVATTFAGDAGYLASGDTDAFTVLKEDCTLAYAGDILVAPTASTNLVAQFGELDTSPGSWAGKQVTFTLTDSSANQQTATALTDAAGRAAVSVPLASDVYGVVASFPGDAFYHGCTSSGQDVVTVQMAGSKATGGGWFSSPSRANFGFNVIPEAGGLWKGQFQLRTNNGKTRFHGDVVTNVTVLSSRSMRWTGTGSWDGTPGYRYEITVVDNGSSGARKGDTIGIVVKDPSGATTVYSSSGAQVLRGGNLTVH